VKRSKRIRLVLIGSLSTAALSSHAQAPSVNAQNYYTNNFFVPGAGYYHAPFRQWFALPYNHFDAQSRLYFYGGQWGIQPFTSITNISTPTPDAVALAQSSRTDITRGGFGNSYGWNSYSSGGGWSGFSS
jgi:hypothetical protein